MPDRDRHQAQTDIGESRIVALIYFGIGLFGTNALISGYLSFGVHEYDPQLGSANLAFMLMNAAFVPHAVFACVGAWCAMIFLPRISRQSSASLLIVSCVSAALVVGAAWGLTMLFDDIHDRSTRKSDAIVPLVVMPFLSAAVVTWCAVSSALALGFLQSARIGVCSKCGSDLRGAGKGPKCPECGHEAPVQ